ncbi:MAG: hypothetical protein CM15mV142_170 [Caudoviricetes sp.]|nr:MAG: hypothetical protein CM15mV142_170 [Caudoviricetes sp.]
MDIPFFIKTAAVTGTGSHYTDGVTGNGAQSGNVEFMFQMTHQHDYTISVNIMVEMARKPLYSWWKPVTGITTTTFSGTVEATTFSGSVQV